MSMIYRRKLIKAGDVIEIEAYPYYPASKSRSNKSNKSREAQKALNDKNSLKNLVRMVNTNFCEKDYFVTLTFANNYLPESSADARKVLRRYIQRLRRVAKKSATVFKWLAVIELDGRFHYHLIVSGINPADIMAQWDYGFTDVSQLKKVDGSFTALANYHGKHGKDKKGERISGCKSWSCSRNLVKPTVTVSDTAITERKVRELIVQYDEEELLKLLQASLRDKYAVADCEGGEVEDWDQWRIVAEPKYQINDISGFYLYATYVRRQL